ncbi:MAG: membrane-bound lytic murein transglycosylase B [Ascidiaceihabitans sp.]|jgi:membrane-bound lytic murein transglycosylase B
MKFCQLSIVVVAVLGTGQLAIAEITEKSPRPNARPVIEQVAFKIVGPIRPQLRPQAIEPDANEITPIRGASNADLQMWISGFKKRAQRAGIDQRVLEDAFQDVRYDVEVIKRDRNQSEFTKTIWDYLDTAVSKARIKNGKSAISKHKKTLETIEAKYGVNKEVVAAIWGLESAYGGFRGGNSVMQSLATLAYDGRRGAFFEEQLIAALKILQNGDTTPNNMTGSWAGAMGHTQFIPTSYLDYAVDFTGDGKRDIWSNDPSDALASTAAYLKTFGWITGQPWGVEVTIPDGFDYTLANREIKKMPSDWASVGVKGVSGTVSDYGPASVLLPAGSDGAAFLIFSNFSVIEEYNTADAYVIGVGHLSDRLKGGPAIKSDWPRWDRALSFDERQEMQRRLTQQGFNTDGIDGKIGPKTINAVRDFQLSKGARPDGYASPGLLKKLR